MKCPNCLHVSDTVLLRCSNCGEAYDRGTLEEFQHLEFLLAWLEERSGILGTIHAALRDQVQQELAALRRAMRLAPIPVAARSTEKIARELALVESASELVGMWVDARVLSPDSAKNLRENFGAHVARLRAELAGRSVDIKPPTDLEVNDFALELVPQWLKEGLIVRDYPLLNYLAKRHNVFLTTQPKLAPAPITPTLAPTVAAPSPAAITSPSAFTPPRPAAPTPLDWRQVWARMTDLAVSGALLRGLLYLGAFMIVVSAIILALVYWNLFPPFLRIALVIALPVSFYLGGFLLRTRLKIPIAGYVVTGIGTLLVAIDFIAIYQLGGLENLINGNAYWFIASVISTVIYVFTAWRVPGEFFGYITLMGLSSAILALTQLLRFPLEWGFAMTTVSATGMVEGSARAQFGAQWNDLIRAMRRYPLGLVPLLQLLALFMPGNVAWGQMGTFAAATLVYGWMARRFPRAQYAYVAVASSVVTALFALRAATISLEWYATISAILSALYLSASQWLDRRVSRDFEPRREYLVSINVAGLGWLIAAAFLGAVALAINVWAGVLALSIVSLVLIGCAIFFRQPLFIFASSATFIVPYSFGFTRILTDLKISQAGAWLMTAWALLALLYLGTDVILRRQELYVGWLNVSAHILAPFVAVGLLSNYLMSGRDWLAGPTLAASSGLILVYIASAIIHESGRHPALSNLVAPLPRSIFLIPVEFLLPIWLAVLWSALGLDINWFSAAWVGLAYLYLLSQRALAMLDYYRVPLQLGAILILILGLAFTFTETIHAFSGSRIANYPVPIVTQALGVGLTIFAAWLYRSRVPLLVQPYLAFFPVTLFFIGYGGQIFGSALTPAQFALVWTGLGVLQILAGALLDRAQARYSHALYLGGYALVVFALAWSFLDRLSNIYVLGVAILVALASHLLTHFGTHHTFDDFLSAIWRQPDTLAARGARAGFIFIAAYAFPIWLTQLLILYAVPLAWRGLALAATAPNYIVLGLLLRRIKSEYAWPLYTAAYALTALGAMVAFDDELIAIYVLAFNAIVYAASAYIFRQAFWLYLSNTLVPTIVLILLHYGRVLTSGNFAWIFMSLAFIDGLIGFAFDRLKRVTHSVAPFALPFYSTAYLLSAVALAVASSEKTLALSVYSAGVILYALSAFLLRETLFLYPAVWLAAVPYFITMTLTALPPEWYGIGWMPLIIAAIAIGKTVFHQSPIRLNPSLSDTLAQPALPFYIFAYALSVHMIVLSLGQPHSPYALTAAYALASLIYLGSAGLFHRAFWLYPGLFVAHLAVSAFLSLIPSTNPPYYVSLPFLGVTWLVALTGYGFSRLSSQSSVISQRNENKFAALEFQSTPIINLLLNRSWAQPFFVFAILDALVWQIVALNGYETAIIVAAGLVILAGLFAMVWQDRILAYAALGFFMIGAANKLAMDKLSFADTSAWIGGIGLGLYVLARLLEILTRDSALHPDYFRIWVMPLTRSAVFFTLLAILFTLPFTVVQTTASAAALAFGGALYLAIAYRGRYHRLGYLGTALLEIAWVEFLVKGAVAQPQLYAIPAGLYFTSIGFFEKRRGNRLFATLMEIFGLAVLLLTAFIQSLNGAEGFPYFLLLLVEALLTIWWGAARRIKIPFFIGIGASVLNVVAQVAVLVNVYDMNRFLVIFLVGVLLVIVAVFVERQRALIISKMQEWRAVLETWD